jgi:hypothetical protein
MIAMKKANPEKVEADSVELRVHSSALVGPYGRCRSETSWRMEEVAQGPASSCRVTRRAKGTDPRRFWIPEEFGCCLWEGVLQCKSGMAQEEHCQGVYQGLR